MSLESATSSGRHDWSVFRRINENERAFLLDTGVGVSVLVSNRGVSDADVAGLRALAVRKGALRPTTGVARLRPLVGVAIGLIVAAASILTPILLGPPR